MGAQAAAALAAAGPLGVPRDVTPAVRTRLPRPEGYRLSDVALAHGGIGLAPWGWDGTSLTTVLADGVAARVLPDLTVELSAATDVGPLRRVLDLDRALTELWAVAPHCAGEGWELRAATPFEGLVQALAATNTAYRSTQAMLEELVGDGPFPTPAEAVSRPLQRWGYRLPHLRALAERVDDTDWDGLADDDLTAAVRRLPGFGPFAAASVLPLLGRRRPLVVDGWLASQVDDVRGYERYGAWGGTVLWLDVSRRWRRR